jgi:hypothetical protein
MSTGEARWLRDAAQASGQSIEEVVGRAAFRGDMWEFIELVLAPPKDEAEELPAPKRERRTCPDCGLPAGPTHDLGCPALGGGGN